MRSTEGDLVDSFGRVVEIKEFFDEAGRVGVVPAEGEGS